MKRSNDSERLTGPWSILANANVSNIFRTLLGRSQVVRVFNREYIKPEGGESVIDFGCGLGGILAELKGVDYLGVDVDTNHIKAATQKYSDIGKFKQVDLLRANPEDFEPVDLVLARGFLHHIDDQQAHKILKLASSILKPNGRLLTIDPVKTNPQNPFSRLLVNLDRGTHVRNSDGYRRLVETNFNITRQDVRTKLLRVPYSHCLIEARKKSE